jgi:formamidopyrimidine-DNA glycosylase
MATDKVEEMPFLRKMGPEPWAADVEERFIFNMRRHEKSMVKPAILDQSVMAGIGNIYADESLWAARVHPEERVGALSDRKLREICRAAGEVMQRSIDSGGSTMKNYVRADGTRGNYLEKFAKVFRREGLGCPRCGTVIIKIRVAGRGTHICPRCQRLR